MIVGLGTDLCEVDRIAAAVKRSGERFLARVFTPEEREAASGAAHPHRALASFFAIKESAFKALRRGWPYGVSFDEVRLESPAAMRGRVVMTGRALELARALGASRFTGAACADDEIATAVVIAEGPAP